MLCTTGRDEERIYINEHLTAKNASIFKEARKLVKAKRLKSTWSKNGVIYIRTDDRPSTKPQKVPELAYLKGL